MRRARYAEERGLEAWPRHSASIFALEAQIVLILCLLLSVLSAHGQQRSTAGRSARPLPQTFDLLATLQAQAGRSQEAIATLRKGLKADLYLPRLYGSWK